MNTSSTYPPLLLIHGAWHGKWCYEPYFIPFLESCGFAVHAVDLPGHGEQFVGTRDIRWRSIDDYVDAVAQYAASLEAPPILVGHSMGGLVVQKCLERHPAAGAVLLASVPVGGVWQTALNVMRHHPIQFLKVLVTLSLQPLVDDPSHARDMFFSKEISPADLQAHCFKLHDESFRAFLDMLILNLPRPKKVAKQPMLVIGAENDTVFSVASVERTAAAYGIEATVIASASHDLMLDPNWQQAADCIADWVRAEFS